MRSLQLTPQEFDAHIENGTFRLSFIGMSNAGKTYRSRKLHDEKGFLWYHVDEEIQKALGFEDMARISCWLGYPTDEGYALREKQYLDLENKFTRFAAMQTNGKNLVFDTTGSVVHLEPETTHILKENCLIVHLDVEEDSLQKMKEKFFEEPKPVAWSGYFVPQEGESLQGTFERCYPVLLRERLKLYRELAHINIPAKELREKTAEDTLSIIRSKLV